MAKWFLFGNDAVVLVFNVMFRCNNSSCFNENVFFVLFTVVFPFVEFDLSCETDHCFSLPLFLVFMICVCFSFILFGWPMTNQLCILYCGFCELQPGHYL